MKHLVLFCFFLFFGKTESKRENNSLQWKEEKQLKWNKKKEYGKSNTKYERQLKFKQLRFCTNKSVTRYHSFECEQKMEHEMRAINSIISLIFYFIFGIIDVLIRVEKIHQKKKNYSTIAISHAIERNEISKDRKQNQNEHFPVSFFHRYRNEFIAWNFWLFFLKLKLSSVRLTNILQDLIFAIEWKQNSFN